MMNILFVSSHLLYPAARSGGAKRLYNLAKSLESKNKVWVTCFDGIGEIREYANSGTNFEHFLVLKIHKKNKLNGLFKTPFNMANEFLNPANGFLKFVESPKIEVVFLAYPLALGFPRNFFPNAKFVYIDDDLVFEKHRLELSSSSKLWWRTWLRFFRLKQLILFYAKNLSQTHLFIAISKQESEIINKEFPKIKTSIIPYGIDMKEYPILPLPKSFGTLGYIGNFNHLPNFDAVEYFRWTIWPEASKKFPDLKWIICGTSIPKHWKDAPFHNHSIEFLEDVKDLSLFYKRIDIFINPVITGRGLRTKIIEASAYGRAIISTSLGKEGVENLEMMTADNLQSWLESIKRLVNGYEGIENILTKNREVVKTLFSNEAIHQKIELALNDLIGHQNNA